MTGEPEHATDVTDLREAQRLIAELRRQVAELQGAESEFQDDDEPPSGEFWVSLDDEHTDMFHFLWRHQYLYMGQPEDVEPEELLSEFVTGWLDVQWDLMQMEQEAVWQSLDGITHSA